MSMTMVTLTGFVAMEPKLRFTRESHTAVVTLRVGTTPRRVDTHGQWSDGTSSFFTVNCWRRLALGVAASLRKGQPILIRGRLKTRTWNEDGKMRSVVEIDADSIGHDISFGWSQFVRGVPDQYAAMMDTVEMARPASGLGRADFLEVVGEGALAGTGLGGMEPADGSGPPADAEAEGAVGVPELAAEGVPF